MRERPGGTGYNTRTLADESLADDFQILILHHGEEGLQTLDN